MAEYFITPRIPGVRPKDPPDYDGITFSYVFTQIITPWVAPPVLGNVTVVVANNQGFVSGMTIAIQNAGYYQVVSTANLNQMTIQNLGYPSNAPPGTGLGALNITTTSLPGPMGPTGPQGPGGTGPQGNPGPTGPPGPTGAQGIQGPTGNTGPQGNTGPTGAAGAQGPQGATGAQGTAGATGPQGATGSTGSPGAQGATGPQGPPGPAGTTVATTTAAQFTQPAVGSNVNVTMTSAAGISLGLILYIQGGGYYSTQSVAGNVATLQNLGYTGNAAPAAVIASGANVGATGPQGPAGPQGIQGTAGATGSQGVAGATGAQGPTGNTGPTGPAGSAATVAIGTTTTGAAGSNATVTNSGTSSAAVLNFTVPQGAAGATGAQGPAGATGSQGPTGNTGPTGTPGSQGPTGATGPAGPTAVSADAGNLATLGSDSLISVPTSAVQPVIWSVRLRSFNAIGNPTFEVDQRNVGTALTNPANGVFIQDRWQLNKSASLTGTVNTALQSVPTAPIVIPGTNFGITQNFQRFTVGTVQAALAAGDFLALIQFLEGPRWRELSMDVHSVSLLVRSTIAGLAFGLSLSNPASSSSLSKLCTISSANIWTLIPLPNIPVWSGSGFVATPGSMGYYIKVCLASGATYIPPANNIWQSGNFIGAVGMSNFLATAGATFDIAFCSHEPGAVCTTPPMDCPFGQNLDGDMGCMRYYQKSYDYATAVGALTTTGSCRSVIQSGNTTIIPGDMRFPKPMAKDPTLTAYSDANGAINAVYDNTSAGARSVSGVFGGEKGIFQVNLTAAAPVGALISYHWTADTAW